MKNRTLIALGCFALMLACGGSSSSPAPAIAKSLVYTDPTGTGWRLVKNSATTSTHLVLDLMPPAATTGSGVALTLGSDATKATWAKPLSADTEKVHPGTVYTLGSGTQAVVGVVKGANLVSVVAQKGATTAPTYDGTKALLSVSLDFAAVNINAGTAVPLTVVKASHLPGSGSAAAITVAVGTITAQ